MTEHPFIPEAEFLASYLILGLYAEFTQLLKLRASVISQLGREDSKQSGER